MRSRLVRFLLILSILLLYTACEAFQLLPAHPYFDGLFSLVFFVIMISAPFVYRSNPKVFEVVWFRVLAWSGSLAMGLWATFILISLPFDFVHAVVSTFDKLVNVSRLTYEKQSFLYRGLSFSVLGLSGGMAGLGLWEVLRGPRLRKVSVSVPQLNHGLEGLKLLQISDLHVGPTLRKGYVDEVVRRANEADADFIFVTGDLADAKASSIADHLEPLRHLRSRYGVFYVTGNHEYYWDVSGLMEKAKELGLTPLINENRVISIADAKVLIAGVTDPMGSDFLEGHAPDTKKAFQTTQTDIQFRILLAHRPDACEQAEGQGCDLQLSGHTHAGQFFPFTMLIGLFHKYSRGLYRHGRMWIYVNPGTGYWGPANRLGVAPEITLLSLTNQII